MEQNEALLQQDRRLSIALDIGEQLLISGAEIARCEDTIERICRAYGFVSVHVFTVTAGLIVTVFSPEGESFTQLRRVKTSKFNLSRLEALNQLSRDICRDRPDPETVKTQLAAIAQGPVYPLWSNVLTYAFISAAFSAFFSGTLINMPAAAITGSLLCLVEAFFFRLQLDPMFNVCACSFLAGLTNVALIHLGIGFDFASISIGNIMLLIPGIVMTNAIRDIFGGDFISGTSRLAQSMLLAFLVAFGFTSAGLLL